MESENPEADVSFEDGLTSTIDKYSAPAEAAPSEEPSQEPTTAAGEETEAANPESTETTEAVEPELSSVILAKLADKDAEARSAREQLKQIQEELAALKADKEPVEATPAKDFLQEAVELGLDRKQIQAVLLAEELGDDTPDDVKAIARHAKQEIRLKRLERPQDKPTDKADPALTAQVVVMQNQINSFVDAVPDSFGMLSGYSKENPDEVRAGLEQLTATMYKAEGKWPSVNKVAQLLQDSLEEQLNRLSAYKGPTASSQSTPSESTRQTEALSDAESAQLPDRGGNDPTEEYDFNDDVASAISALQSRQRG